jgi:hypothetical protein
MNKLKTILVSSAIVAMSFSSIANSIEFRAGLTANATAYYGNVEETLKDNGRKTSEEAIAAFNYASGFAEVALSDAAYGITFGAEYVPDAISLTSATRVLDCSTATSDGVACATGQDTKDGIQSIQADVTDLVTGYVAIPLMSTGLSVKIGLMQGSLETKETLATGSSYKDEDLAGKTIGMFYDGDLGEHAFYRVEAAYIEFDDISATGSEVGGTAGTFNKIVAELGGVKAALSIGARF